MQIKTRRPTNVLAAAGSLGLIIGSAPSLAETTPSASAGRQAGAQQSGASAGLEEIVVTVRRRAEILQKVPVSVSALSAKELEQKSITSADDIQFHVPELQVNPSQYLLSAEPSFTLRGLSTTVPGTTIADTAVTTYFGDVPVLYTRDIGHSLYDLQDVQVLLGPQGTLFGKNSTGGAVIFDPKKPGGEAEGVFEATLGDYNLYEFTGAVNVPISDALQIRVAGKIGRHDGYTHNLLGPDDNDEDFQSGRISINFDPTDWLDTYTLLDASDSHENIVQKETTAVGGPALTLYGPGAFGFFGNPALGALSTVQSQVARQMQLGTDTVATTDPNFVDIDTYTLTNVAVIHLGDDYSLKNIVSYQHSKSLFVLNNGGLLYDFAAPLNNGDNASQTSEEFQIIGKSFNEKLDWIFGVFYGHQDDSNLNVNKIFGNYNPAFNSILPAAQIHDIDAQSASDAKALYAHGTYDLSDILEGLKFNLGYRYTWDDESLGLDFKQLTADFGTFSMVPSCALPNLVYPNCLTNFAKTFQAPSWTIGMDYQVADKTLLYVTSRRGFKSGGFNSTSGIPGTQEYKLERITDVEVGVKSDWEVGEIPLRTNLSLYRGELDNATVPLLPVYQGNIYQVLENVKGAVIRGGEFSFSAKPTPQIDLSGSYSLTVSEYSAGSAIITAYGPGGSTAETEPLAGDPVTQSSKHTTQFSARYDFETDPRWGDLAVSANYAWRSTQLIPGQGGGDAKLPQFGLLNLRADLTDVGGYPLDIAFWVKNVTDKRYITTQQLFLNVLGANQVTYGNPRTLGANMIYRW